MLNIAMLTSDMPLTVATSTLGYLCGAMRLEPIISELVDAKLERSRERSLQLQARWVAGANFAKGLLAVSISHLLGAGDLSILAGVGAILGHGYPLCKSVHKQDCEPTFAGVISIMSWPAGLVLAGGFLLRSTPIRSRLLVQLAGFVVAASLTYADGGAAHVVLYLLMAGITLFLQRL